MQKRFLYFFLLHHQQFRRGACKIVDKKTVVLIGSLDTKSDEIAFLRDQITAEGYATIVIDVGILYTPLTRADIPREQVAMKGGSSLEKLIENSEKGVDKETAVNVMAHGASEILNDLFKHGKADAVIAVGGAIGTAVGTAAMKGLPYGIPKIMISIVLSSRMKQYVDSKDIVFINYPTDLLGLNFLTRKVLSNACGAVSGMLKTTEPEQTNKKLVAITCLGVTTPAVLKAKQKLEQRGYETIVYSIETEGLDELLEKDLISAVLDLTPYELINIHLMKTSLHTKRMAAANEKGIPQIIVPGGLDFLILACPINDVPEAYRQRQLYKHSPHVTLVRINKTEAIELGRVLAERANAAKGPTIVLVPLKGFSSIDMEGQPFFNPQVDESLLVSLKKNLDPSVKVIEVNAHINDEEFADLAFHTINSMLNNV